MSNWIDVKQPKEIPVCWVIEPEVFNNDPRLEDALKVLHIPHYVVKFGENYCDVIEKNSNYGFVVFHGSHQFIKEIAAQTNWFVFCNESKFECTYIDSRFGSYLFNSNLVYLPFGKLTDSQDWLCDHLRVQDLFVKSNSFKKMTGQVVSRDEWKDFVSRYKLRLKPEELIAVGAASTEIVGEWRFVIGNNEIISGTPYKNTPNYDATSYVKDVLSKVVYQPHPIWVMDVCMDRNSNLHVLECGPFSCCGLYDCDYEQVVTKVNEIVRSNRRL